ncbi:MAG: GntR family transcriptional regulator [Hyphomicrobiales bacterium]|nr:GntR family transcriptional regulator [Hyphomicrobiales bacterium]MBV9115535.1 GntR family transcriptional regulator [Hyphomicrobiales bacterium]MBV9516737.1 GntR family transcriptional regulator [Hyphomicrobiales bacterium]
MLTRTPEYDSIGERTYRRVRTDILFAKLLPNQRLKLDRLREDYHTSVGTLRELLSRLASEGLVIAEGQRGFTVAPVSAENLREIASLRLLLESHALTQSFAAGDMDWEGRVVAAHHKLAAIEKRLLSGEQANPEAWKRYDWEFHQALIGACGSNALLEIHEPIYAKYLRYQMVAGVFRGEIAANEHKKLLKSALRRDAAAACAVLEVHIQACVDFTISKGRLPPIAE